MNLSLTGNKAYMEYISRSSNLLIGVIISSPASIILGNGALAS
jgi:hypothetical protein